jgi:hypothetical protein
MKNEGAACAPTEANTSSIGSLQGLICERFKLFDRVDCGQIVFHSDIGALKSLEDDAIRGCVNRC